MPARINVTRTLINTSAFAKAIQEAAEPEVLRMLQETADDAVRRADAIVSAEYNNGRAVGRRRPGPHLLGNFVGEVVATRSGATVGTVRLRSRASSAKVAALNYGSQPHTIGDGGKTLAFPRTESGGKFNRSASNFRRRQGATAGRSVVVKGPVQHPGTAGTHFLERAMEQAVRARLRASVTIPRS